MDRYSYKGLIQDEEQSESGDGEDEPWYPYDPEDVLNPGFESEMDGISFTGGLEGQNTICYGMVSVLDGPRISSAYLDFKYRTH